MTTTSPNKLVQRRLNDFKRRCGEYGDAALKLAYHTALPVALNPELLHFLRINFFLEPPSPLPYTVEFEFLTSGLCREIDAELYEIEPEIRDVLLQELRIKYGLERIQEVATLLWQYVEHHSPWADRVELERSQQLTALNFLAPEKAKEWLNTAEAKATLGRGEREWFIAMRHEIQRTPIAVSLEEIDPGNPLAIDELVRILETTQDEFTRWSAAETLGEIGTGNPLAIDALVRILETTQNEFTRWSAAETLEKIGPGNPQVIVALARILETTEDEDTRRRTAESLGKIGTGNQQAIDALARILETTEDEDTRRRAVESLRKIGSDAAIRELVKALEDEDSSVRSRIFNPPKVFISYSWDSPEHMERVLELSDRLRSDGIDCNLDQYEVAPPEGWPRWMERQIQEADFVLMICTETYFRRVQGEEIPGQGRGVRWEGNLTRQHLYNAGTLNTKFIPVLLESGEFKHIPTSLQGTTFYFAHTEEGYEALYRHLTNQPRTLLSGNQSKQRSEALLETSPTHSAVAEEISIKESDQMQNDQVKSHKKIPSSQVVNIFNEITIIPEPNKVPFPQADKFERVENLLSLLAQKDLTSEEITRNYQFTLRQTQYYIGAGTYLGLISRGTDKRTFSLTDEGKNIVEKDYASKILGLTKVILQHEVFYKVFKAALDAERIPSNDVIVEIMSACSLNMNTVTMKRRAGTVRGWIEWIWSKIDWGISP